MSDRPSSNLGGLNIDLARQIDEVCRRFEAAWREGRQPRIDDYLVDVLDEGRPALRTELSALERELRQSEQTMPPGEEATVDPVPAESARLDAAAPVRVRYFGDYELIREIARGGMGVVFHARQVSLNRAVAVKMILAGQLANEVEVKRFHIEAKRPPTSTIRGLCGSLRSASTTASIISPWPLSRARASRNVWPRGPCRRAMQPR